VNDEIHCVGIAPVFVGVNHRAVRKECPIGVFEFEGDTPVASTAQVTLPFRAEFYARSWQESVCRR
jgi:hypothetical protein